MRHTPRISLTGLVLVVVSAVLLLAACGSSSEEVSSGGDPSTTTTAGNVSAGSTGSGGTVAPGTGTADTTPSTWTRVEPTDDLVGAVVATPTELVADPDDEQVVLVHFYGGVQDCYGANATVVREDDSVIEIRLETGSRADAGDRACIEIAEAQELAVRLEAPVGDRRLSAATAD